MQLLCEWTSQRNICAIKVNVDATFNNKRHHAYFVVIVNIAEKFIQTYDLLGVN